MADSHQDKNSVDVSRFAQVFIEECAEHLSEMEQILVSLSGTNPDDEQLNAVFRAAHSIKGGAGMFGFEDMTVVTHLLESLLDRLRNHEIPFSTSMVDLFLQAVDVIAMQLAGHRDGAEVSQDAIDQVSTSLQQVIDATALSGEAQHAENVAESSGTESEAPRKLHTYELEFSPDPDIFKRGIRLENLFDELGGLGELTLSAETTLPEDFSSLDPESCFTCWKFTLVTTVEEAEIREIFEFVADEDQLFIHEADVSEAGVSAANVSDEAFPSMTTEDIPTNPGRRAYDSNEMAPGAFGRRASEAESSIRVSVTKVDQLINQVGELVITQAMLAQAASNLDPVLYENLHRSLQLLERNTRDMQQSVMSIRLVPISIVFSRFPRMVRDLAAKLGKKVELKTIGETTELDKGLVEKIADPLTHLVRNCLDHALELPELRVAEGKDPVGTVTLRASQVGGRIVIDVMDDGAGLNREKILKKAAERGIPASEAMTDEEVWQLIFAPGFSTAESVTDISGRGVGMDVVLKNVQALNGRVQIVSEKGNGTRVTISLPLTLAILDGLSVSVSGEKFIIPLNAIIESLQPSGADLKSVNGRTVVQVRGEYIPLVPLADVFNLAAAVTEPEKGILVLVDVDGEKAAIMVDALLDEHQVVIKSMEANYRKVEGTAGATILGDGRVALILDVCSVLEVWKSCGSES